MITARFLGCPANILIVVHDLQRCQQLPDIGGMDVFIPCLLKQPFEFGAVIEETRIAVGFRNLECYFQLLQGGRGVTLPGAD